MKLFDQRYALPIFLLIVFAIAIPLMMLIRAKIDLNTVRESIREPEPTATEPKPLPEPDVVIPDNHPFVPSEGLDQDSYEARDRGESGPAGEAEQPSGESSDLELRRERCEAAGGHWNPCGSSCRNAEPGTACIMVCVPMCECGGVENWTCPEGMECTDYEPLPRTVSSTGICR